LVVGGFAFGSRWFCFQRLVVSLSAVGGFGGIAVGGFGGVAVGGFGGAAVGGFGGAAVGGFGGAAVGSLCNNSSIINRTTLLD